LSIVSNVVAASMLAVYWTVVQVLARVTPMNDDLQLLSTLLGYAHRHMTASMAQLRARLGVDTARLSALVRGLERGGLVYVERAAVRLTLAGFAHALSAASAPVVRMRRPHQRVRSRAA
jgi:hypothetical protein